ncbi:MAG: GGDEF domain-containing protein [bacterium]
MSSSVRVERQETTTILTPILANVTTELPIVTVEFGDALRAEQASLHREVVIWQRWVRYLALAAIVLLSLAFGTIVAGAIVPLAVIAICYAAVVMTTAAILHRSPSHPAGRWFPSLLLAADIATLAGFCFLTTAPEQFHRILLIGFLSTQLSVFYFGRRQAILAGALTMLAYFAFTLVVPPFISGPPPTALVVAFNITLFAIVSAVLIYTIGSFRERMDALRMYCKLVERGEGATAPTLGVERWPDELTLLARSFQSMHARLAEEIGSDPLTGCLNRRSMEARVRADLRQARRRGSTVAVAAIDLDHFKLINDSRGHPVGDIVLQQLSTIMKATVRDTDAVARFGGDEFVIVLPDTGWQGALTFAERLRRRVDDFTFGPAGMPISVTVSVGVALARGTDPISTDMLFKDADSALYKAKTAGRNQVFS